MTKCTETKNTDWWLHLLLSCIVCITLSCVCVWTARRELTRVGESMAGGKWRLWFLNRTSWWDTWPTSLAKLIQSTERVCVWVRASVCAVTQTHTGTPISTAAPKHAGYLGSLRTDLWLKRRMQSQGSKDQTSSCKPGDNKRSDDVI